MEKGQIVTIYEDPITKTRVEGRATLLRKIREYPEGHQERWKVHFLGDSPRIKVERNLSTQE